MIFNFIQNDCVVLLLFQKLVKIRVTISLPHIHRRWGIPDKKSTWEVEDILFWKNLGIFRFVTLPLKIPEKPSFHQKFCKIVLHPLEIPVSKTKIHMEIAHDLLTLLEIPLLSKLTPKISTCSFFNTPGNSISSTAPSLPSAHLLSEINQLTWKKLR